MVAFAALWNAKIWPKMKDKGALLCLNWFLAAIFLPRDLLPFMLLLFWKRVLWFSFLTWRRARCIQDRVRKFKILWKGVEIAVLAKWGRFWSQGFTRVTSKVRIFSYLRSKRHEKGLNSVILDYFYSPNVCKAVRTFGVERHYFVSGNPAQVLWKTEAFLKKRETKIFFCAPSARHCFCHIPSHTR